MTLPEHDDRDELVIDSRVNGVPMKALRGLHGQVVDTLGRAIGRGDLQPGTLIHPDELSSEYGTSRTVIREALRVLESKGLIIARPKTGTVVLPSSDWNLLDHDVILWRSMGPASSVQFHDLLALRIGVEPLAASAAAKHAGAGQVAEMRRAIDQMEAAIASGDNTSYTEADVRFHSLILESSNNGALRQLSGAIEAVLRAREQLNLLPAVLEDQTLEEHRDLLEAIEARDAGLAETTSRHLIDLASTELLNELKSKGSQG
ncbi:FCD domain-containing protein [soil metagenome]